MKVELINYTSDALELLLYTKNTRLQGAQTLNDIKDWPEEKKLEHLSYMRDTIQSSWEFVNYTFKISEVTRAFTHQLVRTRTGSYAQESQRTVDVRDHGFLLPDAPDELLEMYSDIVTGSMNYYSQLIEKGMPVQDARGVLPTNVYTEIIAKFDLRTLHNMALTRLCTRTQGEYQRVFKAMKEAVVAVHPWAEEFIQVNCVWNGTCAFPRYEECPIQKYTLTYSPQHRMDMQRHFSVMNHEAIPIAKDGKTM